MSPQLRLSQKLKVFVSSKNRLRDERAVTRRAVEQLHMTPVLIEMDRWIASTDKEEWLAQLRDTDIVVLLLDESAEATGGVPEEEFYEFVDQEIDLAEDLGKSVLLFLRAAPPGDARSQLVEKTFGSRFPRRYEDVVELADAVQEALLSELFKRYRRRSTVVPNREQFYEAAADLVRKAERRVYLGAATPVVFFGPRKRVSFEKEFFAEMMAFATRMEEEPGGERELVVFFNEDEVRRELGQLHRHYDPALAVENLSHLTRVWKVNSRLRLLPTRGLHTFAIFDDTYIAWLRSGPLWFGIRDRSPEVCDGLGKLVHDMGEQALAESRPTTDPRHWLELFRETSGLESQ